MNNIEKVILSMNKSSKENNFANLEQIVVVRENSIERYNKNIREQYVLIIKELLEQYKEELNGLEISDSINKLWKELNVIEYNRNELLQKMILYIDENNIVKYKAIYDNHYEEVKKDDCLNEEDFHNKISEKGQVFSKIYGIESLDRLKKLGLIEAEEIKKDLDEVITENKIKNFVVNHKVLSGVIASAIALVGIWGGIKLFSKKDRVIEHNNEQIEYATEQPTPTVYNEEVIPTLAPISIPKEIIIESEDILFPNHEEANDNRIILRSFNGKSIYLEDEFSNDTLFQQYRNPNMSNIGNNVQSNINLDDNASYIYFENKFNSNLIDKAYVKYFSIIGNEIIKNAYLHKNMGINYGVDYYVRQSGLDVVRLIRDNESLVVYINGEKKYISYSDLSDEAKEVVLQIVIANNCPTYKDIIDYNGNLYNQDQISQIILDKWDELEYSRVR